MSSIKVCRRTRKPSSVKNLIPRKTLYRLSLYLRCLQRLHDNSIRTVSSEALAKVAGVAPAQLRKDLTYFGHFGTRGLGYDVELLARTLRDALGTNRLQPVIVVGVGNLGAALMSYPGFAKEGFEIIAGFDVDVRRARQKNFRQPIFPMSKLADFIRRRRLRLAILAVPAAAAQEAANQLIAAGISGILNFAPIVLEIPDTVAVNNVNLAIELENLAYFVQA